MRTLRPLWLVAATVTAPLAAQDSVTVVADPEIGRGGLRRLLFGDHYRDLWTAPVRVPVLDLERFAGGLTPVRKGGGLQTLSLRLRGGDGREYAFRVLRKDPTRVLPEELRGTFATDIVRDQMSAMHPGGALIVPPLLEAAGVLHATPSLFVMPHDARLGTFREEFAGQLGTIEERPTEGDDDTPGFAGAREIVDTPELIEALWRRPWVRVDTRELLTARLLDFYLGDWDRHEDQWRWALVAEDDDRGRWHPIPRDRDQAFARYDGLLLGLARQMTPQLLNFGTGYATPLAATWNGRNLDRRLLVELGRATWDSAARELQRVLTDPVIDQALARLPEAYRARDGERLRETLIRRRDGLPEAAVRTYRFLARNVRLQGSDRADHAEVERSAGGTRVRLSRANGTVWFDRTFDPDETDEIQIDLRDGDDRLVVRGEGRGPLIRAIGGSGADTLIDSSSTRHSRFYDRGDATVAIGRGVDHRRYVQPADTNPAALPRRDWGSRSLAMPWLAANSDLGFVVGYTWMRHTYGFRRQPNASAWTTGFQYSTGRSRGKVETALRWRLVNRPSSFTLDGLASGIEHLQFYGVGNLTTDTEPDAFYRVRQEAYEVSPGFGVGLDGRSRFRLQLRARHTITDLGDQPNREGPIVTEPPIGTGDFGQAGVAASWEWDTRDNAQLPSGGAFVRLESAYYPITWSAGKDPFGTVEGRVAGFLSPGAQTWLTFAVRAGGRYAYGDYPYFEASYLGGVRSLRGYPQNRFAGDGAAFGSVEARVRVARTFIVVPGELGVFGLTDGGRVFLSGEESDKWHTDAGGGIYYGLLRRSLVVALGVAQGTDGGRFYLGLGLGN